MTARPEPPIWRRVLAVAVGQLVIGVGRLVTGVYTRWVNTEPSRAQTLYFANHGSHGDFVLVWATLPRRLRRITRPVAGADYWQASSLRRFIGGEVFHALLISRDGSGAEGGAVDQMVEALRAGDSLIMFPEGTRNTGEATLLPLKSGLYHLAREFPQARLVPVWLSNIRRVLPKGAMLPVPLACSVNYGAPIALQPGENKEDFLSRARQALLDLRPDSDRDAGDPAGAPGDEPAQEHP